MALHLSHPHQIRLSFIPMDTDSARGFASKRLRPNSITVFTTSGLLIPIYPFVYVVAFGSAILCLVFIYNLFEYLTQVVAGTRRWVWAGLLLIIVVVLGSSTMDSRFEEVEGLISWSFDNYKWE